MNGVYDLVTIGGGTTGLVAAQVARGLGARVALIEAERPGGDCLWTGCVPSKSVIASARVRHTLQNADRYGLDPVGLTFVDIGRIMGRVRMIQEAIEPADSAAHLEGLGIEVITGRARLVSDSVIDVSTATGSRTITSRKVVLATGSAPRIPPIDGLNDPFTTETIWQLDRQGTGVPGRLVIIGAGAVGCELGQAFRRLGSAVTIIEAADRILPGWPPAAAEAVAASLAADGVEFIVGRRLGHIAEAPPHDAVLVAVGRTARTTDLGLDDIGVSVAADGTVMVDDALRTTVPSIYAGGDVIVGNGSTTLAVAHGRHIGLHATVGAAGSRAPDAVPTALFTDPQVAIVGDVDGVPAVHYDHADHDRSLIDGAARGFTELYADRRGRVTGAVIVSPVAAESIAEVSLAVRLGATIEDLSGPHAYPSHTDAVARAAEIWLRRRWAGTTPRGRAAKGVADLRRRWDRRSERGL